jgi:hypothetical protein
MSKIEFSLQHYKTLIIGEIKLASMIGAMAIVVGVGLGVASQITGYEIVRVVAHPAKSPTPSTTPSPVPEIGNWSATIRRVWELI